MNPVVLPPQVCIVAISTVFDAFKIVESDHSEEKKQILYHKAKNLCFSADHRVLDGATIAKFSELIKKYIEKPMKILAYL